MNRYAEWFRRIVFLGILVNLFFALPGTFIPNPVLELVGIEPARDPVWPAFSSSLLILLSLFYIPAALDPLRNRAAAILTVFARVSGAVFFLLLWPHGAEGVRTFGYLDLVFAIVQGTLLFLAFRAGPDGE